MSRHRLFLALPWCLGVLSACASQTAATGDIADVPQSSDVPGGITDIAASDPADPDDTCAILKTVNTADAQVLEADVGLPAAVVAGILAARAGADGKVGTNDDVWWTRLTDLYAVPLVDATVADLLLTYVRAHPEATCARVNLQVLAFNDFHGALDPPTGAQGTVKEADPGSPSGTRDTPAGGAVFLAAHLATLVAQADHTVLVSAGDLHGGSPLLSALFHEEPTVGAMNRLSLAFSAIGNHDLDKGWRELKRLQDGSCHPVDGCTGESTFPGAAYRYLATNIVDTTTSQLMFPAYGIVAFGNVRVAFVGVALEETPSMVLQASAEGLRFEDEVASTNAVVRALQDRGIHAIVVMLHAGGWSPGTSNACSNVSGNGIDIAQALSDEVDVVVTGHTHSAFNCVLQGRPVTSAASHGRIITDLDLVLDERTGDVVSAVAINRTVTRDLPPQPDMAAWIDAWSTRAAGIAEGIVGTLAMGVTLTRAPGANGDSSLGRVIADAQREATRSLDTGGAQVAFVNSSGIRADLSYDNTYASEAPGQITYGEAFAVQPFGNLLMTMTLTGSQILALLEQQWCVDGQPRDGLDKILSVSEGFAYAWNAQTPACEGRVVADSVRIEGAPLAPATAYRVTVSDFLAEGTASFSVLTDGTDRAFAAGTDMDAFLAWLAAHPTATAPEGPRITRVGR